MLQDFQGLLAAPLTLGEFIVNVLVACLCGLIHVGFYRAAHRGPGYSPGFLNALILLSMITALVIMVIGDSLARAFGLVGAMSIIRFRTAVKEVMDIVHIFFALAIGMAAGVGMHSAAISGVILVGIIATLLSRYHIVAQAREQFVVQLLYDPPIPLPEGAEHPYVPVIRKWSRQSSVINVRSAGEENLLELSYHVRPKNGADVPVFIRELRAIPGIRSVTLFSDEEPF